MKAVMIVLFAVLVAMVSAQVDFVDNGVPNYGGGVDFVQGPNTGSQVDFVNGPNPGSHVDFVDGPTNPGSNVDFVNNYPYRPQGGYISPSFGPAFAPGGIGNGNFQPYPYPYRPHSNPTARGGE